MQKYYDYIKQRKSKGKLSKEQISKCKEGNVRGIFGYPTLIEKLSKKTGRPERDIDYIISYYGTLENFINLYMNGKLDAKDSILASSMFRNAIDIDLSPNSENYDRLYCAIMGIEKNDNSLQLYSSQKIKEQIEALLPREQYVIKKNFGLLDDLPPRSLSSLGTELRNKRANGKNNRSKSIKKIKRSI